MKLVSVFKAAGQLEAYMIKAFLEAHDVPVELNQESIGKTIGLSAGLLGEVDVLVSDTMSEQAKRLLKDMFDGKFTLTDDEEIHKNDPDSSKA